MADSGRLLSRYVGETEEYQQFWLSAATAGTLADFPNAMLIRWPNASGVGVGWNPLPTLNMYLVVCCKVLAAFKKTFATQTLVTIILDLDLASLQSAQRSLANRWYAVIVAPANVRKSGSTM